MANMNQVSFSIDDQKAGTHLYKVRLRGGVWPFLGLPRKEKALGQPYSSLSVPEADRQKDWKKTFCQGK